MAVAWPRVRSYLAATLPTVLGAGVTVHDGPVVDGGSPSTYLSIASQPSSQDASGGSFSQDVGPDGFSAVESGLVRCELGGITGNTIVPDVFAVFDLIASHLQSHQTLDGALLPGSTVSVDADEITAEQSRAGAVQRLLISIQYTTRLA